MGNLISELSDKILATASPRNHLYKLKFIDPGAGTQMYYFGQTDELFGNVKITGKEGD